MTQETALPGYVWNKKEGRYYSLKTGKPVAIAFILLLLRRLIQDAEQRQGDIATAYYEQRIAPAIFVEQMRAEQRRNVLLSIALAAGGFAMLNSAMLSEASQSLTDTYGKITGTTQDVQDGKVSLAETLARVAAYAGVARILFYKTRQDNAPVAPDGMTTIERRLLGGTNHCDDCINYYDQGWQLAGTLPAPGESCQCRGNCNCDLISQDVPTSELDDWIGSKR